MVDAQWVRELVEANDPTPVIWRAFVRLWEVERLPDNLRAFYDERESWTYRLERFLLDSFPELYDDILLTRSITQDGSYVRRWLVDNNVVIIADSLSVREAVLLKHYFHELDFVPETPFAIAPFPTLTESLAQKLMNVSAPSSGRDTAEFAYRYIAGIGSVDQQSYPNDRPLLIWLRLPDAELEQVTEAQTTKIVDVVERTREVLSELFERLEGRKVIVTSDHGYFYGSQPNHFDEPFRAPEGVTRERRVYENLSVAASQRKFFVEHDGRMALKGRYWWRGSGQNASHTAHGGFSLVEVFVPILTFHRSH